METRQLPSVVRGMAPAMRPVPGVVNLIAPPDPRLTLRRLLAGTPGRAVAEAMIRDVFADAHGARIEHFYPQLLAFAAADGLGAVVGVRTSQDDPAFFAEQYLDAPVDRLIGAFVGRRVHREDIAEIGNLASRVPGDARWLIAAVTAYLYGAGRRWVLFTATAPLYNAFRRIGLNPTRLAAADRARLDDPATEWGRYYSLDPQVCVGDIHAGFDQLRAQVRRGPASMQRLWQLALDAGLCAQSADARPSGMRCQ